MRCNYEKTDNPKKSFHSIKDEAFLKETKGSEIDILQNNYLVKHKVDFAFKIYNPKLKDKINITLDDLKKTGYIDNLFYKLKKYDEQ